ncbi:MAG: ATP-grasp domain-containing protein [Acidimicrobiia bacterium]
MTGLRVLVTGAGGAAGVAVVRHLAALGTFTAAVDSDPLAAGLFLADEHAVIGPACEPDDLVATLAEAVKRFEIDVVLCTVAEEMLALSGREHEIDAVLWLPDRAAIELCLDKVRFSISMGAAGVPAPRCEPGADPALAAIAVPGPWIVKPRFGRGSRDVYAVDDASALRWACGRVVDPIVQSRVSGREFTVDLLTDRGGGLVCAVPRWRLETKAGISTKGTTFADDGVVQLARRALEATGLCGAANLQGFVTDTGDYSVIEVNPRVSGGLSLSLAAGADLVLEYLRIAQDPLYRSRPLQFRAGTTMTRYLQEVILP